jgi:transcriptional regulator with XRE-family HTH domain
LPEPDVLKGASPVLRRERSRKAPYPSDQQTVSRIEQSETIEDDVLAKVAGVLGVSTEAIKNYSDEAVIYNIQNNYEGSSSNYSGLHHCTFNPLDKLIELVEENKKLYERLLQSEREKVDLLKNK